MKYYHEWSTKLISTREYTGLKSRQDCPQAVLSKSLTRQHNFYTIILILFIFKINVPTC